MVRRKNIWEQIQESTEGPTVTVTIPREFAEELLRSLAASLEQDMPDGEDDISGDIDLDSVDDLGGADMDDLQGPPEDEMDLDFMPAGDDDDEEEAPPAAKKGPGRPPGAKKKDDDDDDDDKDEDDDDDDSKDESAGEYRPQTALGESAFSRLSRGLARKPTTRKRR